jgi:sec-independent protein translocase protein TatA
MGTPGPLEIILIFLVVLLIFGAKRIPEIARGIGKGIREFKDATSEISRELDVDNQRQQIDRTRRPQQGTPQARGGNQQSAANDAPPQPAQANNPGDESGSSREQQASQ